ncbi:MAG: hypothetical protein PHY45_12950 [Rhodocyclaceae bacterium]|nr:hypothetical protein [Rhodocyclaceae bacterium]
MSIFALSLNGKKAMLFARVGDRTSHMAIISSTVASSAAQYGLGQLRLQQAKRSADQAEQAAQALQAQAQDARRAADQADENARSLAVASTQAQADAGKARQGLAALQSVGQMETQLANVADRVIMQQQSAQAGVLTKSVKAAPVVNTQGQVTGRVVNTTA